MVGGLCCRILPIDAHFLLLSIQLTGGRQYDSARYQGPSAVVLAISPKTDEVSATGLPDISIKGLTADDEWINTIGGGRRQGVVGALLLLGIDQGDGDGDNGDDGDASSYVLLGDGDHC